ncbi:MAG: NACHT domain-containing protein, partial [Planctomycetaceae bacterium]|nr:NACHT domain-containing protein [Planctomycetaceae bacterium]
MPISTSVVTAVTAVLTKFVLRHYWSETELASAGEDSVDMSVTLALARRQSENAADDVAMQIVRQLIADIDEAEKETGRRTGRQPLNSDHVVTELELTLRTPVNPTELAGHDFDAQWLAGHFRAAREPEAGVLSPRDLEFYEDCLDRMSRYLVDVAAVTPKYRAAAEQESLNRLKNIQGDLTELLRSSRSIERSIALRDSSTKNQTAEVHYRHRIRQILNWVDLFGAPVPEEARGNRLLDAIVSLSISQTGETEDEIITVPAESVLDRLTAPNSSGRLLIRGPAGSGKTTLLRWAAVTAATSEISAGKSLLVRDEIDYVHDAGRDHAFIEVKSRAKNRLRFEATIRHGQIISEGFTYIRDLHSARPLWNWRVPFLIALRNCDKGRLPAPDELPHKLSQVSANTEATWVEQVLRSGRGLILIDGIDEVPPQRRDMVYKELDALLADNQYGKNLFIVTTRPEAVKKGWLTPLGFSEAEVAPLTRSEIGTLIERWHDAVAKHLESMGHDGTETREAATGLIEELDGNVPLRRLATNPLLCAMICALYRIKRGNLPRTQSKLCETLCEMLLHAREFERGMRFEDFPPAFRELTYPQRRDIVQDLATQMVMADVSAIPLNDAKVRIEQILADIQGRRPQEADEVLMALIERSGMLRKPTEGSIDFLHNTFKEFLAGERFAADRNPKFLLDRTFPEQAVMADGTWSRITLFAAACDQFHQKGNRFADNIVTQLIPDEAALVKPNLKTIEGRRKRARQIFALQIGAHANYLHADLRLRLQRLEENVFPPQNFTEAEVIAQLGDVAVDYLKRPKRKLAAKKAAACIRALQLIGTRKSQSLLSEYLRDEDRKSVLSELVRTETIDPLTVPWIVDVPLQNTDERLLDWLQPFIKNLTPLQGRSDICGLNLRGTQVAELTPLAGLQGLQTLSLNGTPVAELAPLAGLQGLQWLSLDGTQVAELAPLAGLQGLQTLTLNGT